MSETDPIRVLVVDNAAMYRKMLSEAVEQTDGMALSGTAPNGKIALRSLAIEDVDLVLLDAAMPETDGLDALKLIRSDFPEVSVVMISGNTVEQARITVRALAMGAVDMIPRPEEGSLTAGMSKLRSVLSEIAELMRYRREPRPVRDDRKRSGAAEPTVDVPAGREVLHRFSMVVIGVSAGGPRALERVIPELPAGFSEPVLVVQHMPPHFTESLAEYLGERSAVGVREARDGESVGNGSVLIAPGGVHMLVDHSIDDRLRIRLSDAPPVNSCRPSVDVLCESVARSVRGRVLAVILTGMGDDGARGVALLKDRGCYCLAQTERTCAVYGMPRAVVERGLADELVDLDGMAARITALVEGRK